MKQGNVHGFNRYAYANNNPYKYTDPNGESPLSAFGFVVGAIGGGLSAALNGGSGGDIVASMAAGGATGALAGLTFGTSLIGTMATGAVASGFSDAMGQTITNFDGENVDTSSAGSTLESGMQELGNAISEIDMGDVATSSALGTFGSSAGKLATTMKMSDNTAAVVTETTNVMTSAKKDELQGN